MDDSPVVAAARLAHKVGLAVVPPRQDGSKAPDVASWAEYQRRRPTREELRAWYANGRTGIGLVMGAIGGNVETIEFDHGATYERFLDLARATGLGELVARIRAGYEEATPGGGIHWPYRCAEIAGNTTLARRPGEGRKVQVLIQTRGEGGYLVTAPSHGTVHPTGGAYTLLSGGFETIATVSPEERRVLWDLARSFDECPRPAREEPAAESTDRAGTRPGDDFNRRATWDQILSPHEWVLVSERGGVGYWRRPGKRLGISATTNHAGSGLFYPFTSSTVFDPERGYSKFSAYSILEHGGDFRAAADALGKAGYGAALPRGRFGTGKASEATRDDDALMLERLTIVANDPRLWRLAVNGQRLDSVSTADLLSFARFRLRCVESLGFLPMLPPERGASEQRQWLGLIAPHIEAAEKEDIPLETTETGRLREMVARYVYESHRITERRTELPQGRILLHDGCLHFRMADLVQYLGVEGFDRKGLGSQVWSTVLRPLGATSTTIRADAATVVRVVRLPLSGRAGSTDADEPVTPDGEASQEMLRISPAIEPKETL